MGWIGWREKWDGLAGEKNRMDRLERTKMKWMDGIAGKKIGNEKHGREKRDGLAGETVWRERRVCGFRPWMDPTNNIQPTQRSEGSQATLAAQSCHRRCHRHCHHGSLPPRWIVQTIIHCHHGCLPPRWIDQTIIVSLQSRGGSFIIEAKEFLTDIFWNYFRSTIWWDLTSL